MTDELIARADALFAQWMDNGGKVSRETATILRLMVDEINQAKRCTQLARDLLDPEGYGHAVTQEVRVAARRALGITPADRETPTESFNDANAWRAAIAGSANGKTGRPT